MWGCVVWCGVCGGVGGASKREAHITDVFVTVEFDRMVDWTAVTTYSHSNPTVEFETYSLLQN